MRVLLSTIGSRGDFQPLLALALQLRELGHEARLCAPPDFRGLAEDHGLPFVPVGPALRAARPVRDLRESVAEMVTGQFATLREAAADCDVIVGCNQLRVTARSVAERLGIRYVLADHSPVTMPSPHHPPVPLPGQPADPDADNRTLWAQEARRRDATFGAALDEERVAAGLDPVTGVLDHILTDRPLLAADPGLAPWPPSELDVVRTCAWFLPDDRPLPAQVEEFLAAGEPPVYFGLGSMLSPRATGQVMISAARALGRRAIVLRGRGELSAVDGVDCLAIAEANFQALFPRVAAVVHHGGAGTTTTAARAGVPQVVVPHHYDQAYFARRVQELGIGVAHAGPEPTVESLTAAVEQALPLGDAARAFAAGMPTDGALVAVSYLHAVEPSGQVGTFLAQDTQSSVPSAVSRVRNSPGE
jgi:vancomycin aglycone glucosyltransferase